MVQTKEQYVFVSQVRANTDSPVQAMVQTKEQYVFVYQAILEIVRTILATISQPDPLLRSVACRCVCVY